jgi:glycerophosphoryl diester phosphodiesterase
LRERLLACLAEPARPGERTIGHRGAPLRYPEHTRESYLAAARLGATTVECDVTFTRDGALVCRHDACDLHRSTDILRTPLAARCSEPFQPALFEGGERVQPAGARCCTTDLTRDEFLSLRGRHDMVDEDARTVDDYLAGRPERSACRSTGTLLTHRQSIELLRSLGVGMAPELKAPAVSMPFDGLVLTDFADRLVAEYREASVPPERVRLQTFDPDVARHWIVSAPDFADRVVWLDGRYSVAAFDHRDLSRRAPEFRFFRGLGLRTIAPPMWMLVEAGEGEIEASAYARAAQAAGLELMTWTLERSGSLADGGGWYYQTLNGLNPLPGSDGPGLIGSESDQLRLTAFLFEEIGVTGIFTDWAATTALVDRCLANRPPPGQGGASAAAVPGPATD